MVDFLRRIQTFATLWRLSDTGACRLFEKDSARTQEVYGEAAEQFGAYPNEVVSEPQPSSISGADDMESACR